MRAAAVHVDLLGLVALVATGHVHRTVVDDELRLGVERIVAGLDGKRAARKQALKVGMQRVVGSHDVQLAARDAQVRLRLDAVVAGLDGERAAVDRDEAASGVSVVVRLDAVTARREREIAVRDLHAIAPAQRILHRIHHVGAARDDQIVLRADRMPVRARHRQHARPVDREIVAAEQSGVGLVRAGFERIVRTVGERVRRPVRQRDEALVRLLHVHRRPILVVDGRASKHHLHLVGVRSVHHQLAVVKCARHDVRALGQDGHHRLLGRRPVAIDRSRRPIEHDARGRSLVVGSVLVAARVFQIERRSIE